MGPQAFPALGRLAIAAVASFALHVAAFFGLLLLPPGGAPGAGATASPDRRYLPVTLAFPASLDVEARPDPAPRPSAGARTPTRTENYPGILPIAGPYYFRAQELDSRLTVFEPSVKLAYPEGVAENLDGRVVLRLLVTEQGAIADALVVESEPAGIFEQSAATAFRNARFFPGIKDGKPVKSQMVVEVRYHGDPRMPGTPGGAAQGAETTPANYESH